MAIRCPKCNFDSADDAAWCDFCKEPFRKKSTEAKAPEATAPVPAKVSSASDLPPEVRERLAKAEKMMLSGGDGEKLPAVPQWFRLLAWAFLGAWFVTGMLLAGNLLARRNAAARGSVLDTR